MSSISNQSMAQLSTSLCEGIQQIITIVFVLWKHKHLLSYVKLPNFSTIAEINDHAKNIPIIELKPSAQPHLALSLTLVHTAVGLQRTISFVILPVTCTSHLGPSWIHISCPQRNPSDYLLSFLPFVPYFCRYPLSRTHASLLGTSSHHVPYWPLSSRQCIFRYLHTTWPQECGLHLCARTSYMLYSIGLILIIHRRASMLHYRLLKFYETN